MVDRIDRLYNDPANRGVRRAEESERQLPARGDEEAAREDGKVRRENVAERIAPHLHDTVELSDQARAANRAGAADEVENDQQLRSDADQIADSWYATGVRQAYEAMDRQA